MKNFTTRAARSRMKTKVQTLPATSPYLTKKVIFPLKGICPTMQAGSHHGDLLFISPEGEIMALMPVFAHLAIALLVSMALRRE